MKVTQTKIPDVLILEPSVYGDERGFFFESFNQKTFKQATNLDYSFVQDNHSRSAKNVLRGLYFQVQLPQEKLCRGDDLIGESGCAINGKQLVVMDILQVPQTSKLVSVPDTDIDYE